MSDAESPDMAIPGLSFEMEVDLSALEAEIALGYGPVNGKFTLANTYIHANECRP